MKNAIALVVLVVGCGSTTVIVEPAAVDAGGESAPARPRIAVVDCELAPSGAGIARLKVADRTKPSLAGTTAVVCYTPAEFAAWGAPGTERCHDALVHAEDGIVTAPCPFADDSATFTVPIE